MLLLLSLLACGGCSKEGEDTSKKEQSEIKDTPKDTAKDTAE
jgi:hypothetical protein